MAVSGHGQLSEKVEDAGVGLCVRAASFLSEVDVVVDDCQASCFSAELAIDELELVHHEVGAWAGSDWEGNGQRITNGLLG